MLTPTVPLQWASCANSQVDVLGPSPHFVVGADYHEPLCLLHFQVCVFLRAGSHPLKIVGLGF